MAEHEEKISGRLVLRDEGDTVWFRPSEKEPLEKRTVTWEGRRYRVSRLPTKASAFDRDGRLQLEDRLHEHGRVPIALPLSVFQRMAHKYFEVFPPARTREEQNQRSALGVLLFPEDGEDEEDNQP